MKDPPINLVSMSSISKTHQEANTFAPYVEDKSKVKYTKSFARNKLITNDLSYSVKSEFQMSFKRHTLGRNNNKEILRKIKLVLDTGQIVALLGSSGSGKTSLLDVIGHKHTGDVTGQVSFGGKVLTKDMFRKRCAYVLQQDNLINMPNLTTWETLHYKAKLRFTKYEMSNEEISQKVKDVMQEMKIWHVRNVKVGGRIMRGISGGEKRRTCIAAQLLLDPEMLLLDEPTTGLDSFTAHEIIKNLADLAHNNNKLVFLTIHQPRSDIFHLLDKIGILCAGEMVFYGHRDELVPYFANIGFRCPSYSNPLDYVVDVSSIDRRTAEVQEITENRVKSLKLQYCKSDIYDSIINECNSTVSDNSNLTFHNGQQTNGITLKSEKEKGPSLWMSVKWELIILSILIRRMFLNISKDRASLVMRGTTMTFNAMFLWMFLPNLGHDLVSVQDRTGVLYLSVGIPPNVGILNAVALYPALRSQFEEEYSDALYGCLPFLSAYYLHIIPFHVFSSFTYSLWAYLSVELYPDEGRFFIYFTTILLGQYVGEAMTVFLFSIIRKPSIVQSFATIFVSVSILLASGLIGSTSSLLLPLQWLSYTSYIKYTSEILVANEYNGLKFECEQNGTVKPCPGFDGNVYLDFMFPGAVENEGRNYGILVGFGIMFWIFNLILLKWNQREKT